jgi:uncharacterized protein
MPNHLAAETSPYLQQHKDNPVDWHPWGQDALERARREDKPILLSIGYSTCHWCHVMAHESFEDPEVAAVMNRLFVNIKVDREERPDLDQIYQTALQILTRRAGGWPLTMFLTPDQVPFFGGTYFPREPRFGLPGFVRLMENVDQAYRNRRPDIGEQNASLLEALSHAPPGGHPGADLAEAPIREAVTRLKANFEPVYGGYGAAPKFPRPADLEFLLDLGDGEAGEQVLHTLRKMAEGGLNDQLGGGFFRYSVDERWAIPHFEKMLYDNGPLLGLYAEAWAVTGDPLFARTAERVVEWLEREMVSPEGLFYSALDADSEHEEGKFYVWQRDEVRRLLPPEEYAVAGPHWGLDSTPNFENRAWHLGVDRPLGETAAALGIPAREAEARLERAGKRLFEARAGRVRPGRDDKVITGWNALMIKGLARAARRLSRPDWLAVARRAADALRGQVWQDGRLSATWQEGRPRHNGYLDDYAFLLDALLELIQAEYRPADLAWAGELAGALLTRFEDPERGGFWFTSHDHERLIHRTKPAFDDATPSGNGVAARALGRLGHVLGSTAYLKAAERAVRFHYPAMAGQPGACPTLLAALRDQLGPPRIVVLRGPRQELEAWVRAVGALPAPHALFFALPSDLAGLPETLAKPGRDHVSAYVCAGVNCLPEIVQMHDLLAMFRDGAIS